MCSSSQRGFTLLELSIVIVVIGLISGGIMVGNELIRVSEIASMNRDVNMYKSALNSFRLQYQALPGDMKNATRYWGAEAACPAAMGTDSLDGTCNGTGDNIIYQSSITNAGVNNEMFRAWEHLALAGMIPGDFTGKPAGSLSSTAVLPGLNAPAHRRSGFFLLLHRTPATSWFNKSGHVFVAYGATATQASLTPADAASMDAKYDDGRPGYGLIGQYSNSTQPGCITSDDATTAVYDISNQNVRCQTHLWLQ